MSGRIAVVEQTRGRGEIFELCDAAIAHLK